MKIARAKHGLVGLAVALATAALMLATEPSLAIGWDEGYTLGREARLRAWLRLLSVPDPSALKWEPPALELVQSEGLKAPIPERLMSRESLLFDPDVVGYFWPFAREEPHGHPPFYAILGLVGDVIAPSWPDLARARLGPILLFSLTAGVLAGFFLARYGPWPSALAVSSWVLQPNLFGHGHYAAYDGVLTSLWALAVIVFARGVIPAEQARPGRLWPWAILMGVILGCAAATKLTGWFLPLPFLAWGVLYRSRRAFLVLALAAPIAAHVLFALIPPWWTAPAIGLARFFESNLGRGKSIPIQVLFLGTVYNTPRESLPFYNTMVWTVLVTPVGFLIAGMIGVFAAFRHPRRDRLGVLIAGHWVFLMVLRALPHTPGHDGVRLFLPAFGMLALAGGQGGWWMINHLKRGARALILLAIGEGVVSVALMMPTPLAYYSPIVAGLPGASRLGMEPTYYWDALDAESLRFLREHTGSGETIVFRTFPHSLIYLRSTGLLPQRLAPIDRGRPRWIVIQNRPGAFTRGDRKLVSQGQPAFLVTKLGVPLVWIFPYAEIDRLEIREETP